MRILIGSTALAQYIDIGRTPKDTDYFMDENTRLEYKAKERIDPISHIDIFKYFGNVDRVATLDELYTIKVAHIFWDLRDGQWEKHALDIIRMQEHGANLIEPLYKVLFKVWTEVHGKHITNLSQNADNCFKDAVKRIYVHDSIHASVAYYDAPLYERILMDGEEVKVDKSKWDALSHEDKIKCTREEIYATALERLVIPADYIYSPRRAYAWALRRTTTSLARGWFALFIVENLKELWAPDINYVKVHKSKSDKLIPLKGK